MASRSDNEPSLLPAAEAVGLPARFGRNTLINAAGFLVPLVVSIVTVPAYLHLIGDIRYGILAVVWVLLGYFGIFDLGLGRATANAVARLRTESARRRDRVFWTALLINGTLGVVGGIVLYAVGQLLLDSVVKGSPAFRAEAVAALPWLAAAVPFSTMSQILTGALEGAEKFLIMNVLTTIGFSAFQLAPLAYAYWWGPSLTGLIATATTATVVSTVLIFFFTLLALPVVSFPSFERREIGALFRYGGWITVTGLAGTVLSAIDRVVIAAISGGRNVTRYTIPFTFVTRVSIIPIALSRTLFPRMSMLVEDDARTVSRQALLALVSVMTPIAVIGAVFLDPFFRVWIGSSLTRSAAPVGEILLLGVWLNSLAIVPFAFLQAQRRPDIPAKFHLLEVPPYLLALVLGLHFGGVVGAAWAWTARVAADAVLLLWAAKIALRAELALRRSLSTGLALVLATALGSLTIFEQPVVRWTVGSGLIVVSLIWAWRVAPPRLKSLFRRLSRTRFLLGQGGRQVPPVHVDTSAD